MRDSYLGIHIPDELLEYKKNSNQIINNIEQSGQNKTDFGVQFVKDSNGCLREVLYYSDSGDLLKKIFYNGPSISKIENYRYNKLRSQELYKEGNIIQKNKFDINEVQYSSTYYEYNKNDVITCIRKIIDNMRYEVRYNHDELGRTNSRILKVNHEIIDEQNFKYDIIDRIVEYEDKNQIINVQKINTNNELIKYSVRDKIGNLIEILNKFLCSEYIGTEIKLNGHCTTVKDKSYIDNVMLKKPYASEEDLDLAMSRLLNKNNIFTIQRNRNTDITNSVIEQRMWLKERKILPISVRKMQLLQKVV